MASVDIQHQPGRFFAEGLGELTYVKNGSSGITIQHTGVEKAAEGQGIGKQLVRAAVDWARKEGVKITPQCPFARKVIEGTAEYRDVLA